ncbi:DUF1749 domain-containing protein [Candidatus Dojkabacteria bacterium]|nr:DUF1749 domain-containing protein [Candidatus Dojkabacteria bacterium]
MSTKGQLVQTFTEDDLQLSAFFVEGDKTKPAIIHVHGFEGDFFSNKFVHAIGDTVSSDGNAYLTCQTRGMGMATEFHTATPEVGRNIGGDYERLEEAHYDISAWIKFLLELGYKSVILQGHSLGTIKIVRYMSEGKYADRVKALILLCPFDKTAGSDIYTKGKLKEYVETTRKKVREGKGRDIIPSEYDPSDSSYQTFLSWYDDTNLGRMFDFYNKEYEFPVLKALNLPVHVIVGSKDEYFAPGQEGKFSEVLKFMLSKLKNGTGKLIEGATHGFGGYEDMAAKSVIEFVGSVDN